MPKPRRMGFPTTVLAVLVSFACGDGTTAPTVTPTPPPPIDTNMVGDWVGTWTEVLTSSFTTNPVTCNALWSVTRQSEGPFSGRYQHTGDHFRCGGNGPLNGTVTLSGDIEFVANKPVGCAVTGGSTTYFGVVSSTGAVTAHVTYTVHCDVSPYPPLDYRVDGTYTMNRRDR
jgi:hypothetical protein